MGQVEQAGLLVLEAIGVEGPVQIVDSRTAGSEESVLLAVGCNAGFN